MKNMDPRLQNKGKTNQPIIVKSDLEKLEKTETQIYSAFIEAVDHLAHDSFPYKTNFMCH